MLKSTGNIPKNVYPPPQKKLNNYFKRIMYHHDGVIYLIMYNSYQLRYICIMDCIILLQQNTRSSLAHKIYMNYRSEVSR